MYRLQYSLGPQGGHPPEPEPEPDLTPDPDPLTELDPDPNPELSAVLESETFMVVYTRSSRKEQKTELQDMHGLCMYIRKVHESSKGHS